MTNIRRKELKIGMCVDVEVGEDAVRGFIKRILPYKKGESEVKVELRSGTVGDVLSLVTKSEYEKDKFKFYNLFFHSKYRVTIWNKQTKELFVHVLKNPVTQHTERTAYIFSDNETAQAFLKELNKSDLAIRRISRQKPILDSFKGVTVDSFRLDEQRKVTKAKLKELEHYFNQF